MRTSNSLRWLVVVAGAAMLLAVVAACSSETVEVPGETVVVEKVVTETVEVPGETVVVEKEVIRTVEVPGETVTKEVVKEVMVPGETVVVEKEVIKTVEVPGETVTVEVVKTVEVPGETVVVEKEVVKTVEVPGQTVVVEKVVVQEVPAGYVTDPSTGKAVTAPQYGGTLTTARRQIGPHCDSFHKPGWSNHFSSAVVEKPYLMDWAVDRDVWHLASTYRPPELMKPLLAVAEQPDPLTVILNVREGIHWHDKAPMNGRELVAEDFVYNYHRVTGTGSGFTEAAGFAAYAGYDLIESIEATDKYTVEFKLKEDTTGKTFPAGFDGIMGVIGGSYYSDIFPPEVIQEHGDVKDCSNLVGTGPFELTEYVLESSITYDKNPSYHSNDPKYPENSVPYIDQMTVLFIPEPATYIAALRTAKIDYVGVPHDSQLKSIDQIVSLAQTNPEIELTKVWYRSDNSFAYNVEKEPFGDLRVRQAIQMALDHETINSTYFKGYGNPTPQGRVADDIKGYSVPFAEWPAEIKKYYTYDPEGAEALLDEAGFPRGSDGIRFKTHLNNTERHDLSYHELVAGYLRQIGIQAEIVNTDWAAAQAKREANDYEGFWAWSSAGRSGPLGLQAQYYSKQGPEINWMQVNDPVFDKLYEAAEAGPDAEELKRLSREMGLRAAEMHWMIWGTESPQFNANWPWIKGYNGEIQLGITDFNYPFPYLWIDQDMKKAMGY